MCLIAILIIIIALIFVKCKSSDAAAYAVGEEVTVRGKIESIKRSDYSVNYLTDSGWMVVSSEDAGCVIGDEIEASGSVKAWQEVRDDGQFDQETYYYSIGIKYRLKAAKIVVVSPAGWYERFVNSVRDKLNENFDVIADDTDSGVLKAIVLGDKSSLDTDYYSLYQRNGIAHLLAISGLHISFVGLALYRLLRKSGISCIMAFGSATVFLTFYGTLTGNGVSAKRAIVMCVVSMGAEVVGRRLDVLSSLSLAAVLIVCSNPYAILNNGFLLSFSAILGICLVVPVFTDMIKPSLDRWCDSVRFDTPVFIILSRKSVRFICLAMVGSLGISIFTLPVILYSYYEVPVLGVFLNIIVIPLMSVVLSAGIAGGVTALVSPSVGTFFIGSVHYILKLYQMLCNFTDGIAFNRLCLGQPKLWQIAVYYTILLVGIWMYKHSDMVGKCLSLFAKNSGINKSFDMLGKYLVMHEKCLDISDKNMAKRRLKRARAVEMLVTLAMMFTVISYRHGYALETYMIDVGQGDSIFVSASGLNMLFDGGSTDTSSVGTYRIYTFLKSHGVSSLDYVFVSHSDKDHINGITELIDMNGTTFTIKTLVMPYYSDYASEENYTELVNSATQAGIRVIYASAGNMTINKDKLSVRCVSPFTNVSYSDVNASSAVYLINYDDFSMLLTGDMTQESEKYLSGSIGSVTVLKVAHHGSKTSSGETFVNELSPAIALISCGVNNSYGHPASVTIDTLNQAGSVIYETDTCGQISLIYDKNKVTVQTKLA